MNRQFCDRCGLDITDKHSSAVRIIADADPQGNGIVTKSAELCAPCRRALERWLVSAPPTTKRKAA